MQWYNGEVPYFEEIERYEAEGGDVCSDGTHCGIFSNLPNTTISANGEEVVSNNWGWRKGQENTVKFFALNEIP